MIELEQRLRAELARSVAPVRPEPEPLRRLLRRHRRRRYVRFGAALVAILVAVTGGMVVVAGGQPSPRPAPEPVEPRVDEAITSEFTRQLLAAPTRGNLAGDTELVAQLTDELAGRQELWHVDPSLDQVTVLLLADVSGVRMAEAAYHNDQRAVAVVTAGPAGATAAQLAAGDLGGGVEGLRPFSVRQNAGEPTGAPHYAYVTALAPPGCQIATSDQARYLPGGAVERTWVDQGGVVVRPGRDAARWWRFTCAGVVRDVQAGPALGRPATLTGPATTERGHADPAQVEVALAQWQSLPGLPVTGYRAVWGGVPPGETLPVVVVIGESAGGQVQVCATTGSGAYTILTVAVAGGPLDVTGGRIAPLPGPYAAVTTATAVGDDLIVVRLPDPANPFVLSDRMLVLAPAAATRLSVTGSAPQTVPLTGGVGVLTAPLPATTTLTALDAGGASLATATVAEPDADGLLFGQALLRRW